MELPNHTEKVRVNYPSQPVRIQPLHYARFKRYQPSGSIALSFQSTLHGSLTVLCAISVSLSIVFSFGSIVSPIFRLHYKATLLRGIPDNWASKEIYRALIFYGRPNSSDLQSRRIPSPGLPAPHIAEADKLPRFRMSFAHFTRCYYGHRFFFLFLPVLICLSSGRGIERQTP